MGSPLVMASAPGDEEDVICPARGTKRAGGSALIDPHKAWRKRPVLASGLHERCVSGRWYSANSGVEPPGDEGPPGAAKAPGGSAANGTASLLANTPLNNGT
ncbi:hypothetical protein GCM10017688_44710 [Streptomyces ramulosus]